MVASRRSAGVRASVARPGVVRLDRPTAWRARHARRVRLTDTFVLAASVFGAQLLRFDGTATINVADFEIPMVAVAGSLVVLWKVALHLSQADDERVIGFAVAESNRIVTGSFGLIGVLALAGMATSYSLARGFWAGAFALSVLGLLCSRKLWRLHVNALRTAGQISTSLIVVGKAASVCRFLAVIDRAPSREFRVVGVVLTDASEPDVCVEGLPRILPDLESGLDVVLAEPEGAVVLTTLDALEASVMRELAWKLDELQIDLMVAPEMLTVAGPRLTYRPESGLPLMYIERPRYLRATTAMKRSFDVFVGAALLLVFTPLLIAVAVAVKCGDGGSVFYRSERMGMADRRFWMWKFRTMVPGADRMRAEIAHLNEGSGVLFKVRSDPRVTRVGNILRRYSLDELPQLFNVLGGTMSLVGPRPPLIAEVAEYDAITTKRMLVRPGMTGLWQVSGRSDLSWEETVHLDLTYVENWSLAADLHILWRTFRAVRQSSGAY